MRTRPPACCHQHAYRPRSHSLTKGQTQLALWDGLSGFRVRLKAGLATPEATFPGEVCSTAFRRLARIPKSGTKQISKKPLKALRSTDITGSSQFPPPRQARWRWVMGGQTAAGSRRGDIRSPMPVWGPGQAAAHPSWTCHGHRRTDSAAPWEATLSVLGGPPVFAPPHARNSHQCLNHTR